MRYELNGPSGHYIMELAQVPEVPFGDATLGYQGRTYKHAGTQDGVRFYREVLSSES